MPGAGSRSLNPDLSGDGGRQSRSTAWSWELSVGAGMPSRFSVSGIAGSFDPKPGDPMLSRLSIANRCAVGVVPREPFFQWVQQVLGHESTAIRALEPLLFLIPCYRDQEEALEILEDEFGEIFCMQLLFWCTDLRMWLTRRTFDLFLEWFDVRTYSMVGDMGDYPLGSEEFNEYFLRKVLASAEERSSC